MPSERPADLRTRLERHLLACGAVAGATLAGAAAAQANVVYSGPLNGGLGLAVPSGGFLAVSTGDQEGGVPGFRTGTGIGGIQGNEDWLLENNAAHTMVSIAGFHEATMAPGWVGSSAAQSIDRLAYGAMIDSMAGFDYILGYLVGVGSMNSTMSTRPWFAGVGVQVSGYVGFGMVNEAMSSRYYYGWARVRLTPGTGAAQTVTLLDFAFESSEGVGITAGDTGGAGPVPEPSALALTALAAGAAAWRARRRRADDAS